MSHGLFVVGTDNKVGKTTIATALLATLHHRKMNLSVMKPIEIGCPILPENAPFSHVHKNSTFPLKDSETTLSALPSTLIYSSSSKSSPSGVLVDSNIPFLSYIPREHLIPKDSLQLMKAAHFEADLDLINPYRFFPMLEPSIIAKISDVIIDFDHILSCFSKLCAMSEWILVEGVGGLFTPISQQHLLVDLVEAMNLPLLLVAPSKIGITNHCLLALEALRNRNITLAGVILNRLDQDIVAEEGANPYQIENFYGDVIRGVFPFFSPEKRTSLEYLSNRFEVHIDLESLLNIH
jgi:dethiobiotin synthase